MTEELTEVRDQTLAGEVEVDGKHFINCQLDKVELHYAGGALPMFENCEASNVSWYFEGAALRTIQLLQAQNHNGAAQELIDALFNRGVVSVA